MSCNYADGLSSYENKGVLGVPERFDDEETVSKKCRELADYILASKHVVFHTGAGCSTAAGIPDFRGPNGVWTLEKKGEKPTINVSFDEARPTKTHMAIRALIEAGLAHYVVTQNIDSLHLKSGLQREFVSELHGSMFLEQCSKCKRQFVRSTPAPTVGVKPTGGVCPGGKNARSCRGGVLLDNILDWEHDLPDNDLDLAFVHSSLADLNICLGTTLQIVPAGNLPLKNKKKDGKMVICNLQPTKHDSKADLLIPFYVDTILEKVCKCLGVEILEYSAEQDPTKMNVGLDWTIPAERVMKMEKLYAERSKDWSRKRKAAITLKNEMKEIVKIKKKDEISE